MTNSDPATYGEAAVRTGTPDFGKNGSDEMGLQTDVSDTLANVMHYCREREIDFDEALESGRMQFNAEAFNDEIEGGDL